MNIHRLTMQIEDPVLDAKYKNHLYERTIKVIPYISFFFFVYLILNIVKMY